MNPHKLNQRAQERNDAAQRSGQHTETAREFATPEELLRHDASQVTPPPEIAARLGDTIRRETPPDPWWKRIFGKPRSP